MENKLKCVLATHGLATEADGHVKMCCMSTQHLDVDGVRANVNKDSLKSIWENSKKLKEIRLALDKGIKHPNCKLCWDEEEAGRDSKRSRDNLIHSSLPEQTEDQPYILDLKLGNTCNLKCRTCGTHSSSKWADEEIAKSNEDKKYALIRLKQLNEVYSETNVNFWEDLKPWFVKSKHVDFYGGEPFLIKRQWEMINHAIDTGTAKDISIHYNTNSTMWKNEIYDYFPQFKSVNLDLSIDGIGKRFEFMRHPAKWDLVSQNIKKFKDLADKHPNIQLGVCMTLSAFNVYYAKELVDWFEGIGLENRVYLNLLHHPSEMNIQILPDEAKHAAAEQLAAITPFGPAQWAKNIITFMFQQPHDPILFEKFKADVAWHDNYRQESFAETFPEWARYLNVEV